MKFIINRYEFLFAPQQRFERQPGKHADLLTRNAAAKKTDLRSVLLHVASLSTSPATDTVCAMPPNQMRPSPLGDLEIQALEYIWSHNGGTAKEAHESFGQARGITLNTVQSTLERLHRKGYLHRRKTGHAYRYHAAVTRSSLLASLINDVLGRFSRDSASSAAAIVDAAERVDDETLRLLEEAIRKRRQEERDQ
jgi:predicted transcriptional regulator